MPQCFENPTSTASVHDDAQRGAKAVNYQLGGCSSEEGDPGTGCDFLATGSSGLRHVTSACGEPGLLDGDPGLDLAALLRNLCLTSSVLRSPPLPSLQVLCLAPSLARVFNKASSHSDVARFRS